VKELVPPFDFQAVVVETWTENGASYGWIALMAFLVAAACGLVGNFLVLRRMSLVGDAISHSVLPGLAGAFLLTQNRGSFPMFLGALAAGVVTTVLIAAIHRRTRVKEDAAIGIVFTTLFAIGVLMIAIFADRVDLDADCVLYGELSFVGLEPQVRVGGWTLGPEPVVRMGAVLALTVVLLMAFYKELLVSSFDGGLAKSLGIRVNGIHYGLMALLSAIVVSAFESVGAILVIAMLILPAATARLLADRLPVMLALTIVVDHCSCSCFGIGRAASRRVAGLLDRGCDGCEWSRVIYARVDIQPDSGPVEICDPAPAFLDWG
jgi:manganese/zinc/iron transport system permease protein